MSVTVTDNRGKWDALLKRIAQVKGASLTVGIHADEAKREDGGDNVLIGAVHEFGAPGHKPPIPQRAFLRPGVASAGPAIGNAAVHGLRGVVDGTARPMAVLGTMGNAALAGIYRRIDSNIGPALSKATIANRIRRTQKGRNALNKAAKYTRLLSRGGIKFVRKGQAFGKGTWKQSKITAGTIAKSHKAMARVQRLQAGRFTALVDTGQLRKSITYKVQLGGTP